MGRFLPGQQSLRRGEFEQPAVIAASMGLKAVTPSLVAQRGVSELSILVHVHFDVGDFRLEL